MSRLLRTFANPVLAAKATRGALPCLLAAALLLCALSGSAARAAVRPLSAKQYAVLPKCSAPEPGHASCLSVGVVRRARPRPKAVSPAVISPREGEVGYRPSDLQRAYELPKTAPAAQTIALVDAFNDPTAEADLKSYDKEFALPECTKAAGCFSQVSQSASKPALPFPKTTAELEEFRAGTPAHKELAQQATEWGGEISLDIETAHAICQNCHILLVEAKSSVFTDLEEAETRAEALSANEISNSWGGEEEAGVAALEASGPFNHPNTVITASAGDSGYLGWYAILEGLAEGLEPGAGYPSSSPHVVAVGGTRLELGSESKWAREQVWNGYGAGGGGCSVHFAAPEWQLSLADWSEVGCATTRSVSDVSADADPYTGVAVRYTGGGCSFEKETAPEVVQSIAGWCPIGGTSLASPLIAAVFALAGGSHEVAYPAKTLYEGARNVPGAVHDITEGSNGMCEHFDELTGTSLCSAKAEAKASCPSKPGSCMACPRYDGATGIGTPKGLEGFAPSTPVAEAPYDPASCELEAPPAQAPSTTEAPAPRAATTSVPPPPAPPPPPPATPLTLQLTSLGLTTTSVIALNRHPTRANVAFAFRSNMAIRLRVTLARRVRSHGRTRWVTVGRSITISAAAGRNVKRLTGAKHLPAGTYRLTLTPSSGKPRSILFHIG
jgi:hypothetical protein